MKRERKCVYVYVSRIVAVLQSGFLTILRNPGGLAITRIGRFHAGYSSRESSGSRFAKGNKTRTP